jgi:hypothetical protein
MLATTPEGSFPVLGDLIAKAGERAEVRQYGMVVVVPLYDRAKPLPLFRDSLMSALHALLSDRM